MTKGKPWKNESYHSSFLEADSKRSKLLDVWASEPTKHEGMQVKVKALSEGRFVVKTRLHPDFDQKKENKNGKNRKRNKKNTNRGMFDPTTSI